ncbi:tetratricopeptide repeat protein [Sulfurospirillum diekertiae]|uniref:Tetratricopeptide repeat protein n=1 Tax=Sulfurospirillum diekertiae TaxID=1854492 RepID=A0A6G9VQ89_9BACT|nr:tetratricopeptide repeat protein [Sulfurospirillum diekertiae]QIR75688.1 tetratricopeptide repeat protein [Sulfurospirillum diekertiae]QIR78335.1 tetratricopeptide repeat protein [Sulfurospirillum diekertiae]
MVKSLLLLIGLISITQAGLLDFWNANQAKEAYAKGDYSKASSLYQSLDQTNENAAYNLGNAYYKEKAYDKALEAYQHVKDPKLLPQTLHNMGNSYAQLHQNDQAIKAYESALKLKEDKDTRFNLELLKKEQQKQDQKQNNSSENNQKKDNQQKSSSKEQPKDSNTSQNSSNSEPQQSDKPAQHEPKNAKDTNTSAQQQPTSSKPEEKPSSDTHDAQKHDAPKKDDTKDEQQAQAAQADDASAPISNHEEHQWDKILNQRGVNTLMLPLSNKGEKDDTSKPW